MYKSIYGADASYCNNGNALNAAEIFFLGEQMDGQILHSQRIGRNGWLIPYIQNNVYKCVYKNICIY